MFNLVSQREFSRTKPIISWTSWKVPVQWHSLLSIGKGVTCIGKDVGEVAPQSRESVALHAVKGRKGLYFLPTLRHHTLETYGDLCCGAPAMTVRRWRGARLTTENLSLRSTCSKPLTICCRKNIALSIPPRRALDSCASFITGFVR